MPEGKVTLLLKNCTIYDGTGAPPASADVGIKDDTIVSVGQAPAEAETTIDVRGLAIAPGFIDTHGHSEFTLLADPSALGKVLQGITIEINGNCGLSAGPLYGEALERREDDLREYDIKERWNTLGEYLSILEKRDLMINFSTLAGHGSVRASVMGYADREPTGSDMAEMKSLLAEALSDGAIGLSTGLIYPPGIYSSTEELAELARHGREVSARPFIYTSHMRSESDRLIEAIEETLGIGEDSGAGVHISHIKTAGRENWHKADAAIALIDDARNKGVRATCDRYPYTAGSTDLDSVLPKWAFEGGSEEEMKRLQDPAQRAKIKDELPEDDEVWEGVVISSVPQDSGRWLEGLSVKEIAKRKNIDCRDALLEVLINEGLRVGAIFHGMSEENLWRFLSLPYAMVGSDSAARSLMGATARGKPHPRGFGSFPRFLRNYPGGLPEAIRKATALPAETFGIEGRGLIKEGYKADIVVFDTVSLNDRATYEEPFRKPDGIVHVIINGVPAVFDGEATGMRSGKVLRGGV